MKKQFVLCMIIMCACAVTVAAQDKQELKPRVAICTPITVNDTIAMNLKLKTLFNKETVLKNKIKEEDSKRNAVYKDVSPETQEMLNDRQDSICLDLRSQLVDVQMEILELKKVNLIHTVTQIKVEK